MLDQYAAAMHHLATDIWPQNNAETRIEWCYTACMDYFFGEGLKHIRDKAARRQNYQNHAACGADKLHLVDDSINCRIQSFNCAEPASAMVAVESTKSYPPRLSFTV